MMDEVLAVGELLNRSLIYNKCSTILSACNRRIILNYLKNHFSNAVISKLWKNMSGGMHWETRERTQIRLWYIFNSQYLCSKMDKLTIKKTSVVWSLLRRSPTHSEIFRPQLRSSTDGTVSRIPRKVNSHSFSGGGRALRKIISHW